VRKLQRFKDLPISLKISSTKRVWVNGVVAIKTAGVRILKIFVRILQTKLTVAGKLASVLYCCLKTMTPYDDKKHLQDMGFNKETETVNETPATIIPGLSDANERPSDITESVAFTK
jgi:hypothetical protein